MAKKADIRQLLGTPSGPVWRLYRQETALLLTALITPIIFWEFWPSEMQRAGGIMVALAVFAEFITLNRANTKHIRNAARVMAGQRPLDFSPYAHWYSRAVVIVAVLGTLLWVFGDLRMA